MVVVDGEKTVRIYVLYLHHHNGLSGRACLTGRVLHLALARVIRTLFSSEREYLQSVLYTC